MSTLPSNLQCPKAEQKNKTQHPWVHVAIIGTAGRKEDRAKMNASLFRRMCTVAHDVIIRQWGLSPERVRLVSGGSAWSDHVAVRLYLGGDNPGGELGHEGGGGGGGGANVQSKYGDLLVYFPCELDAMDRGPSIHWAQNPGPLLKRVHAGFALALTNGRSTNATLAELVTARAKGATIDTTGGGFHARNRRVAAIAQYALAFTWSTDTDRPTDGGTLHTWNLMSPAVIRRHIPLHTLVSSFPLTHVPATSATATSATATSAATSAAAAPVATSAAAAPVATSAAAAPVATSAAASAVSVSRNASLLPFVSTRRTGTTKVVCLRREKGQIVQGCDVYIGRAINRGGWSLTQSKWHNPFTVSKCGGSAAEAIRRFEQYIRARPELMRALPELQNKVLGCWCKKTPSVPCHGDVLVKLLAEQSSL